MNRPHTPNDNLMFYDFLSMLGFIIASIRTEDRFLVQEARQHIKGAEELLKHYKLKFPHDLYNEVEKFVYKQSWVQAYADLQRFSRSFGPALRKAVEADNSVPPETLLTLQRFLRMTAAEAKRWETLPRDWGNLKNCVMSDLKNLGNLQLLRAWIQNGEGLGYFIEHDASTAIALISTIPSSELDLQNKFGTTPLMEAATHLDFRVIQSLLDAGVNPDLRDCEGKTALVISTFLGDEISAVKLIKANASLDFDSKTSFTIKGNEPFSLDPYSLKLEGREDEELNCCGCEAALCFAGYSQPNPFILWLAIIQGHTEIVRAILERKIDVTVQDMYGRTALFLAALHGRKEIAEMLMEEQPQIIDIPDKVNRDFHGDRVGRRTPLIAAISTAYGPGDPREDIALTLIEKGADCDVRDYNHQTVLGLARANGLLKVAEALERRSQKPV